MYYYINFITVVFLMWIIVYNYFICIEIFQKFKKMKDMNIDIFDQDIG